MLLNILRLKMGRCEKRGRSKAKDMGDSTPRLGEIENVKEKE